MAKTHRGTWKKREAKAAKLLGTTRTPLSGGNSKVTRSDTFHDELYVECKLRAKDATRSLFEDTKKKALKEKKVPILILAQKYKPGSLVVFHTDDIDIVLFLLRKSLKNGSSKGNQAASEGLAKLSSMQAKSNADETMSVPWDDTV